MAGFGPTAGLPISGAVVGKWTFVHLPIRTRRARAESVIVARGLWLHDEPAV